MGKECEIEVLDIDVQDTRRRLKQLKAAHIGVNNFKRIEFVLGGDIKKSHSWIRVRTDGKKSTITLKQLSGKGGFTPKGEYEVETDSFKEAARIMSKLADSQILYYETQRDAYKLGRAYVTIDKWPGIPHFLEVEAPTMKEVKIVYELLGIKGRFIGNASVHKIYESYGLDFHRVMARNDKKLKKLLGE